MMKYVVIRIKREHLNKNLTLDLKLLIMTLIQMLLNTKKEINLKERIYGVNKQTGFKFDIQCFKIDFIAIMNQETIKDSGNDRKNGTNTAVELRIYDEYLNKKLNLDQINGI